MGDQSVQSSSTNQVAFQLVKDPLTLLPILKERYPKSCFMQNQVMKQNKLPKGKFKFYFVSCNGQPINLNAETLWIVSQHLRGDYSTLYSISAPTPVITGAESIPQEIFDCFSSGGNLIDWDDKFIFVPMERQISKMIVEISAGDKLNITEIHPCYLFYMDPEESLKLNTNYPNVNIQRLSVENGGLNFLMSTWKYAQPQSRNDIPECLEANVSSGVFLENGKKCVSGVYSPGFGLLSALYTLKEERGKGYAKMTMHYSYKETAKEGCIPCSAVECRNQSSVDFHKKLGAKVASIVDWIDVHKLVVD